MKNSNTTDQLEQKKEANKRRQSQTLQWYPRALDKLLGRKGVGPASSQPHNVFPEGRIMLSLLVFNLASALLAPMDDCDEVFNYWEPLHFVWKRVGLQTWEYAPNFALRSYSYLSALSLFASLVSPFCLGSKIAVFYAIRLLHAFFAAFSTFTLIKSVFYYLHPAIANALWIISLSNSGLFIANSALLPNSLSSYFVWIVAAYWLQSRYPPLFISAGLAFLFGWPFVAVAVIIPFFSAIKFSIITNDNHDDDDEPGFCHHVEWSPWLAGKLREFVMAAFLVGLYFALPAIYIDYQYYGKLAIPILNLILYNVFSLEGGGPDLYGTEPWYFYLVNCLLHYHIWFVLAILAIPLNLVVVKTWNNATKSKNKSSRSAFFALLRHLCLPLYLALFIFSWQSHKEERFMFILYPWLVLNAAISVFLLDLGLSTRRRIKKTLVALVLIGAGLVTVSRLVAISSYHDPIPIYRHLSSLPRKGLVCVGSEWYRFPSHFFLDEGKHRLGFLQSPFRGLLPAYYVDAAGYKGRVNPLNREEMDRYSNRSECQFFIAIPSNLPSATVDSTSSIQEFSREELESGFEAVKCIKFVENQKSRFPFRSLWIPSLLRPHNALHLVDYCLYEKKALK